MLFELEPKDSLTLVKPDGTCTQGIKGTVQPDLIYIPRVDIEIERGDILMVSATEQYIVIEPVLFPGYGALAGYQCKISRKKRWSASFPYDARLLAMIYFPAHADFPYSRLTPMGLTCKLAISVRGVLHWSAFQLTLVLLLYYISKCYPGLRYHYALHL